MIIIGKDCEDCRYCSLNEESKARVKVICGARDGKSFYWGQCIPCELKSKILEAKESENVNE